MRLIIAGSRIIKTIDPVVKGLIEALKEWGMSIKDIDEIVSGKAKGVDLLGEEIAKNLKKKVKGFPAKWNDVDIPGAVIRYRPDGSTYNVIAGHMRNAEMAKYADRLLAIWDGRSKGTKNMIDIMKKAGKEVYIKEL